MAVIMSAGIDLSKIDESKIVERDGRKWLNIQVVINDEFDQYSNNVSVIVGQTQEEREQKAPKTYLGNGKVVWSNDAPVKVFQKTPF